MNGGAAKAGVAHATAQVINEANKEYFGFKSPPAYAHRTHLTDAARKNQCLPTLVPRGLVRVGAFAGIFEDRTSVCVNTDFVNDASAANIERIPQAAAAALAL